LLEVLIYNFRDMYRYKMIARFARDIKLIKALLPDAHIHVKIVHNSLPKIEVLICTYIHLADLRDIVGLIPNGKVMLETLAQEDLYTGSRIYEGFSVRNN
jgi:hypothetical protein